jgi:hypothetical protein
MKNLIIIISCLSLFTSCKTREILSKSIISSYNLDYSSLIGTEVFVTDPIRMKFDTLVQSTSNNKGFIDVQQIRTVDKVTVKLQSKGIIQSVDHVSSQRLLLGVSFEDRSEPIYFLMTKFGVFQLFIDENGKVPYGDHNYTLTSTQIPQLEVIIRKNKNVSQSKIVMDGY